MEGGTSGGTTSSTLLSGGGRQRFEVELRPGETTIVSWKKLIKDANKAAQTEIDSKNIDNKAVPVPSVSIPPVPGAVNPALDTRVAPISGQSAENEGNDAPGGSRFSAVIEKIERLYMGKNSSDEEDLNDVPDDDEYDSDDSFIDDAELDDYFQVDYSAIKHDGFFVNRGKLERTNEPTVIPTEQPKKRRRKDSTKGNSENNDGNMPNKQLKINKKEGKKIVPSVDKNSTTPSRSITIPTVTSEDMRYQSPIIALGTVVKKPSDPKNLSDPSSTKVYNGEGKVTTKNIDKQKTGVLQTKKHVSKSKDGLPSQKTVDKGGDVQLKSQGQMTNNSEELNQSALPKEKNVIQQQADIKASDNAQHPQKTPQTVRKEGSVTKAKGANTVLEKAIRDLEKTVAEIRPPSTEVTEADNPSQAVKRRMPPEIKQKLAKVARVAHAIRGKLSKELLNRLMSIVGHLIQIRSLKRNLQNMVDMGESAKKEKDAKLQQLKKEVDEMVKLRAPMMKPEAIEQQAAGSSDDFRENSTKEKVQKTKYATNDALEDKLCELYDLFVDGLDEDAGPQLRKFYAELAELWPNGCMDNQGIKRAIYRAKERKKALHVRKDQEKIKRKKLLAPNTETVTIDPISAGQVQPTSDKLATEISEPVRSISSSIAAANTAPRPPHGPTTDKQKQEKLKGNTNNQSNTTVSEVLVKKKAKRKHESELDLKKSTSAQGEEKGKTSKQIVGGVVKPATTQPPVGPTSGGGLPVQPVVNGTVDMV
ncbi:ubinuclein-1-like [Rutidosis leptorrhynchoides]|uniref:ubinuclein-1-like n=1 Tax=Rutidosis leptorrhynchoides TaxID=125765 RepID=UPI003A99D9C3